MKATTGMDMKGGNYEAAFSGLPNNTIYSNPLKVDVKAMGLNYSSIDRDRLQEIQLKALSSTSGGGGTAGYALVPIYVDPRITDLTRKYTPLVEIIPRVTNRGMYADYNQITAKGGAGTYSEGSAISATDTTYDRQSTAIKFIYTKGKITGQAMAAIPSYTLGGFQPAGGSVGPFNDQSANNAKQMEVLVKTREMREKEEDLIMNGNATTSATSTGVVGANGTEFDGIITLQASVNDVDKGTAALDWDDIETAIRYAYDDGGRPTVAIASSDVVSDIRKILIDVFRITPADVAGGSLSFGIPTAITIYTMVGPVTVIPSMFMSNTSGSKAIYFLDMSVWEMRVLQDMTYQDMPDEDDNKVFMLKMYETLICKNTAFNSCITEISA